MSRALGPQGHVHMAPVPTSACILATKYKIYLCTVIAITSLHSALVHRCTGARLGEFSEPPPELEKFSAGGRLSIHVHHRYRYVIYLEDKRGLAKAVAWLLRPGNSIFALGF